jgi:hypothetical protein
LLVYLVEEEMDIYIGVLVVVCHLTTHLATSVTAVRVVRIHLIGGDEVY